MEYSNHLVRMTIKFCDDFQTRNITSEEKLDNLREFISELMLHTKMSDEKRKRFREIREACYFVYDGKPMPNYGRLAVSVYAILQEMEIIGINGL